MDEEIDRAFVILFPGLYFGCLFQILTGGSSGHNDSLLASLKSVLDQQQYHHALGVLGQSGEDQGSSFHGKESPILDRFPFMEQSPGGGGGGNQVVRRRRRVFLFMLRVLLTLSHSFHFLVPIKPRRTHVPAE